MRTPIVPTSVAALRPNIPALEEDPAFRTLDDDGTRCTPVDPAQFAPTAERFLLVLNEVSSDALERLGPFGVVRRVYRTLPIVELDSTPEQVGRIPPGLGVVTALPALALLSRTRKIAIGFDYLATVAARHAEGGGEGLFGGRRRGDDMGYPVIVRAEGRWMLDLDPTLDWPAPPAIIPVVNMSVGTDTPTYPYVTNDIVNLATFGASRHVLVVLSAGNCGRAGNGSMSAWALPTWVLAVGASEDRTGAVLADYSSRGIPSQPGTGPDLVAFGRSAVPPHPRGTSFAAPRVAGLARLVAAAICQLGREVRLAEGGAPEGVPLVGYGMIDTFGSEIWQDERGPVPFLALPVLGVDAGAVHELVTIAKAAGITVDVAGTPQLLRDLVVGSARPMPGYEPHEVGAGFVDRAAVLDHLGRVTGADVVRWFGSGDADPGVAAALAGPKVFVREELDRLADVLGMTGPVWPYDYTRGRVALLPSSETERSQLPPDEQAFGIPLVWPANPFAAGPKA